MEGSENQEPPKMLNAARRSHRKTRTGCRTCKRRKIKCDEGKPSCWNCIKHSVACDFAGGAAQSPSSSSQTPANASTPPTQQASFISDTGIWSSPSNAFSSLSLSGRHLPELNLHDLELLHHFSVSTCFSVTADPVLRNLWRAKIPQIGFSNKFVMRGILAISALHLAYLHPENKDFYYSHSMEHHELALKEATKVLPNVTSENCTALHIFSILTCMHTLGRPRKPEDFLVVGEHGIAKWLVLFRGVTDIIEPYDDVMASGPLAGLFQARVRRQKLRESCQVEDAHLRDLHDLILQTTRSETMIPIYISTIANLQRAFTFIFNSAPHTHETGDVFVWLFRVSNEYLQALKEGTQEALAIFAYSCVLFKRMEGYWWMEGWSVQLMSNIYDFLDEEHRLWVRWPIKEIGWTPKY